MTAALSRNTRAISSSPQVSDGGRARRYQKDGGRRNAHEDPEGAPTQRKILITGFEPFGGHPENPSGMIASQLDGEMHYGAKVVGGTLPVVYRAIDAQLPGLIDETQPAAILMLGLASTSETMRFERLALNLDDAPAPDNDGDTRIDRVIDPTGPAAYWSTLPLDEMAAALELHAVPVSFSRDAGGYLCNHVFFRARHCIEQRRASVPTGFVHLPWPADWPSSTRVNHRLEFATLHEAVRRIVAIIAKSVNVSAPA